MVRSKEKGEGNRREIRAYYNLLNFFWKNKELFQFNKNGNMGTKQEARQNK